MTRGGTGAPETGVYDVGDAMYEVAPGEYGVYLAPGCPPGCKRGLTPTGTVCIGGIGAIMPGTYTGPGTTGDGGRRGVKLGVKDFAFGFSLNSCVNCTQEKTKGRRDKFIQNNCMAC